MEERINTIIREHLAVSEHELQPNASFKDDLGADSLDAVELILAIEDKFGIDIPDIEMDEITTIEKLYDCVRRRVNAKVN